MLFRLNEFASIDQLEKRLEINRAFDQVSNSRRHIRIAVIDDQDFAPQQALQNHSYDISMFRDVPPLDNLVEYQILMVDILGVGTELDSEYQGAHVIHEIKKRYPDKYVLAYTGGANDDVLGSAIQAADDFISKDAGINEWCDLLDEAIAHQLNPAFVWKRVRQRLLDAGATPYQLAELEDAFVRSFKKSSVEFKSALPAVADKIELGSEARSIINSLIANALFSLLVL